MSLTLGACIAHDLAVVGVVLLHITRDVTQEDVLVSAAKPSMNSFAKRLYAWHATAVPMLPVSCMQAQRGNTPPSSDDNFAVALLLAVKYYKNPTKRHMQDVGYQQKRLLLVVRKRRTSLESGRSASCPETYADNPAALKPVPLIVSRVPPCNIIDILVFGL